jgi:hypothetical protein
MGSPTFAAPGVHAATGRGHKTLRRVVIVLGVLVIVAVVAVSWLGVAQVPVLSHAFGMDRARDLGVKPDPAAFQAFADQFGISRPSVPGDYTLSSTHHWSGTVQVNGTLSEAALAGRPEFQNANSHVNQIQFRIHDGYAELAAFVKSVPGYPLSGPVYGQFSVSVTSPTTVAIDITQLDFGRIGVPGNVVSQVQSTLDDYLNEKISEAGVSIDSLELREGGVYFKGTWPKTITADPPNPNDVP